MFTYFALRSQSNGGLLPEPLRGKDYSKVRPNHVAFPRLFKSPQAAKMAARLWEQGNPGEKLDVITFKLEPKDVAN